MLFHWKMLKIFSHIILELCGIPQKDLWAYIGKVIYIFPILEKEKHSNCATFPSSYYNTSSVAEMSWMAGKSWIPLHYNLFQTRHKRVSAFITYVLSTPISDWYCSFPEHTFHHVQLKCYSSHFQLHLLSCLLT